MSSSIGKLLKVLAVIYLIAGIILAIFFAYVFENIGIFFGGVFGCLLSFAYIYGFGIIVCHIVNISYHISEEKTNDYDEDFNDEVRKRTLKSWHENGLISDKEFKGKMEELCGVTIRFPEDDEDDELEF